MMTQIQKHSKLINPANENEIEQSIPEHNPDRDTLTAPTAQKRLGEQQNNVGKWRHREGIKKV